MKEHVQKVYSQIVEMSDKEAEEYFNNDCHLVTRDFGELLTALSLSVQNHNKLSTCLKSKKFKEMPLASDEYGNPAPHLLLYTIVGYCRNQDKTPNSHVHEAIKESLMKLLLDEDIKFPWDALNDVYETPLHIVYAYDDVFSYADMVELTNIAFKHNLHGSNKDIDSISISQLLSEARSLNVKQKQYLLNLINSFIDNEIITIDSSIYSN